MRTLQEKYNGVNEGAFSKEQFLRDARMQLPNLVSQYNGYDDAIQILKNRGMIQEQKKETSTAELMRLADEIPTKELLQGLSKDAIDGLKKLAKKGKKKLGDALVKFGYLEPGDLNEAKEENNVKAHMEELIKLAKTGKEDKKSILAKFAGAGIKYKVTTAEPNTIKYWNDKEGLSGEIKLKETVKEARLTKSNLTDYRYKATNDMDKYPYEQILRGLRVELEGLNVTGTPTSEEYTKALAKVLKNLEKDGIFYTNQIAGIKANRKRTDVMVDATPKNEVDKENGMQKAALKEATDPDIQELVLRLLEKNPSMTWTQGVKKVKEDLKKEKSPKDQLKEAIKGVIKNILKESPKSLTDPDLYDADEEREERRISYNDQGDFGPESDFGDYYPEGDEELEEEFELQEAKEDSYYKSELSDYLDDNGIFGYTDRIHSIMTGPDEAENADELVRFLEDNQIYGYGRGIEAIYADYPYDQHWMNQPDENEGVGLSPEVFESVSLKDILD